MQLPVKWIVSAAVLAAASFFLKRSRRNQRVAKLGKQLPPRTLFDFVNAVFNRFPIWKNRIVPPQLAVLSFAGSFFNTKALQVVVKLRVAEHLQSGPLSIDELADQCGARADRLARIMRAMNSNGFFEYLKNGKLANNALSDVLRAEHPASVRDLALHFTDEGYWGAEKLYECVVAGATDTPFQMRTEGLDFWEWLSQPENKERQESFGRAMVGVSGLFNPPLLVDYPWERHAGQTVVDVGGGTGGFLAQLLTTFPSINGVLFDRPPVISDARSQWPSLHPDLLGRVEFRGGNFFEEVPQGDVYFLRFILHDWNDAACTSILQAVRRTMAAGAGTGEGGAEGGKAASQPVLLIADSVLPCSGPTGVAGMLDLQMLNLVDGKERTTPEFGALLEGAGLRMREVVSTRSSLGVVVAELA